MKSAKLGDVAPSKPLRRPNVSSKTMVWHLNLDQVESNSGQVLEEIIAPVADANNSTYWFDERHVLYSKLRPYLNKVVVPCKRGIATTELVPLTPDPKHLDRDYLAHYLKSKMFVNWVSSQVAGAKMPRVSMKVFWEHEIPLPPLAEQKRIVAILDKAEAIRRKRQQAIKLADDFLRATFLDMFGDPVTNPKGWPAYAMGELVTVNPRLSIEEKPLPSGHVSFVPMAAVNELLGEITIAETRTFSEVQKGFTYFRDGDVIFAKITPCMENGKAAIAENLINGIGYGSTEFHVLRASNRISKEYLFFFVHREPFRNAAAARFTGSAGQRRVPTDFLKEVSFPLPPVELQMKFVEIFNQVRMIRTARIADNINSTNLFNSLSQLAFRGEL